MLSLTNFSSTRPRYQSSQQQSLSWLAEVHAAAQATMESLSPVEQDAFGTRLGKVIDRCACGPTKIGTRNHVVPDVGSTDWKSLAVYDVSRHPRGEGTAARSQLFARIVAEYFEAEYAQEHVAPRDLIHVTCTGYVSPSGAQRLVASKGWGSATRVTHAYHMGCYAAFPATRLAAGCLSMPACYTSADSERRVDIVHTELCSLHLDPSNHSIEQLVVQSLFADGFIRYSLRENSGEAGLLVLALGECILPDSSGSMGWALADYGMQMNLARDVPERITAGLRAFVGELFERAGLNLEDELPRTIFAVHPGGPKIIDRVAEILELRDAQVLTSRQVLFDHGNMSSATLPHVWKRLLEDEQVATGTRIVSLAFGPGLTICGGLFGKQ